MSSRNHLSSPRSKKPAVRAGALTRPDPALFLRRILLPLALLLALLLQAVFVGHVSAHSELVDSQPADGAHLDQAPERVVATFSEELDSSLSSLLVEDVQGTQVDSGNGGVDLNDLDHLTMVASLPLLPTGTYTVRWDAVSAEDGDDTEGAFTFTIGSGAVARESAAQPADSSSGLVIGAIVVGVLLLLTIGVIYARRRKTAPVET
jgi:methionine-rich copper-binding protein CopC